MSFHSSILAIACAATLCACASAPPAPTAPAPKPTLAALLAQADAAIAIKQEARGMAILKQATQAYPAEKSAWLRAAQVSFDCHFYGDAITYAYATLERDPDDVKANSIAAVSGLRVSSQALRDLAQKNNVTGTVRLEAQQLAKLLRTSIGGDIIVPVVRRNKQVVAPPVNPSTNANAKASKPPVIDDFDPFRVLREDMAGNASGGK